MVLTLAMVNMNINTNNLKPTKARKHHFVRHMTRGNELM